MTARRPGKGFTLLEVLITLIILAIGMLGLANLQSKIHVTEIESYQRAHAVLLMQDMIDRLSSNRGDAVTYADDVILGTDTDEDCTASTLAAVVAANRLARTDRCDWSEALTGASEQRDGNASGGMINARGCIEEVVPPDPTVGVCQPGVYRVTVVWQGLYKTSEPLLTCGEGEYGEDGLRRAIATEISIGLPTCASPPV